VVVWMAILKQLFSCGDVVFWRRLFHLVLEHDVLMWIVTILGCIELKDMVVL